jgi:hypothetical protein
MPAIVVGRSVIDPSTSTAAVHLLSGSGVTTDGSATVGAFEAPHDINYQPDQNNVIDLSQYTYYAILFDEGGTNAAANFEWLTLKLIMGSVGVKGIY